MKATAVSLLALFETKMQLEVLAFQPSTKTHSTEYLLRNLSSKALRS